MNAFEDNGRLMIFMEAGTKGLSLLRPWPYGKLHWYKVEFGDDVETGTIWKFYFDEEGQILDISDLNGMDILMIRRRRNK